MVVRQHHKPSWVRRTYNDIIPPTPASSFTFLYRVLLLVDQHLHLHY